MTAYIGRQLGNYTLLNLLGQGGFADVYLGEHIHLKSLAAIKILHARLPGKLQNDFLYEARILARLNHPHIIRILDFGLEEHTPFLVMEFAPHGTLRQLHSHTLPLTTVVTYVNQIAAGLQYAHDQKLIHRDLKPENILIGQRHELLVSDFGTALVAKTTHDIAGTASYMAPELFQGKPDPASDQYALGIMVFEWLTGACPFQGTFLDICSQHQSTSPPSVCILDSHLPPVLDMVLQTALAKEPANRFPSINVFAYALEQATQSLPAAQSVDEPVSVSKPFKLTPPQRQLPAKQLITPALSLPIRPSSKSVILPAFSLPILPSASALPPALSLPVHRVAQKSTSLLRPTDNVSEHPVRSALTIPSLQAAASQTNTSRTSISSLSTVLYPNLGSESPLPSYDTMAAIPVSKSSFSQQAFEQRSFDQPFSGQINFEPLSFPETALFSNQQQRTTTKRSPLFVGVIALFIIILLGTTSTALFAFGFTGSDQAKQPLQTPTQVVLATPTPAATSPLALITTSVPTSEPTPTVLPTPTPFTPPPTPTPLPTPTPPPVKPTPTPGVTPTIRPTPTIVLPTPSATPGQTDCTYIGWQQLITVLPDAKDTLITRGDFTVTTHCTGPLAVKMLEMPDYPTDVRACQTNGTCSSWKRISSTEKWLPLMSSVPVKTVYYLEFRSNHASSSYVLMGALSY